MPIKSFGRQVGGVAANVQPSKKKEEEVAFGGVSAFKRGPSIHNPKKVMEARGVPVAAGAFPGFVYNGGPVVTCPFVYTSFWGSQWGELDHLVEAGRLSQFCDDLVNSDFMNILSQYGVGTGNGSGLFMQASFVHNVPNQLADSDIHNIIQSCIDSGAIPEPGANNVLIIYLDENTDVNDPGLGITMCEAAGDTAFGYHNFFTTAAGNPFYYAVIPGLDDACLQNSCPGDDAGCSLHLSETQEARRTQVTSHEFAEMCSDPQLNAWYDPLNGECGDICNGESNSITGTTSPNIWTVQNQYSKYDDMNTNGAVYCLDQAPTPEPKLSPGPSGLGATLAGARRMKAYKGMLPLPAARYDVRAGIASLDEDESYKYVRKLFYPLNPENVFSDFPGVLRSIAATMEKKKKH
jgi:hypothetical protein